MDDLTWCATVPDGRLASISVGGTKIMRARRADGFVALGVQLQFHGKQTLEIENRAQRLWKAFWAHKATLRNKDVSLFKRLQFLDAIAKASLFWCSGSWNLTRVQMQIIRTAQQSMRRKVLQFKPRTNENNCFETKEEFCTRRDYAVKWFENKYNLAGWVKHSISNRFGRAGHVARLPDTRLTKQVMQWRNYSWILQQVAIHGSQLHGRRLHIWRWERVLYSCAGLEWEAASQDRRGWITKLNDLVELSLQIR